MITDIWLIEVLTGDFVMGLAKPVVVASVIGIMLYSQVKPRLKNSDRVEL